MHVCLLKDTLSNCSKPHRSLQSSLHIKGGSGGRFGHSNCGVSSTARTLASESSTQPAISPSQPLQSPPCNQMVCRLALRGDTLRGSAARLNNSKVSSSWDSSSLLQSHSMWTLPLPKVSGAHMNGPLPNEPQPILLLHLSSTFANLRHELETTLNAWVSHCSKHMCRANSWRK